jgi:excinuclease ABC subunit C
VFGFYREADRGAVAVLAVRGGRLVENRTFLFDESAEDDGELLTNFVVQYYAGREVPPEVLLARDIPEDSALAEVLEGARQAKVAVRTPQRGAKKDLVAMAGSNAESAFRRTHDKETGVRRDLESLSRALDLVGPPNRMECVDLSMIQGSAPVGAIVVFVDGQPAKELYKRFHIKDLASIAAAGQELSDFAMMKEVLSRRFAKAHDPASAEGPWALPDLMVVDGGKAQLQVAEAVLVELGITGLPLCAIAKDPEHGKAKGPSEERIFVPGRANPVSFQREKGGMFLLQRIRDEAHRFAITFHRQTRRRSTLRSALDSIPGIGDTRRKALLRHFGSAKKVATATLDELLEVPAMSRGSAEAVYGWFHRAGETSPENAEGEGQDS